MENHLIEWDLANPSKCQDSGKLEMSLLINDESLWTKLDQILFWAVKPPPPPQLKRVRREGTTRENFLKCVWGEVTCADILLIFDKKSFFKIYTSEWVSMSNKMISRVKQFEKYNSPLPCN